MKPILNRLIDIKRWKELNNQDESRVPYIFGLVLVIFSIVFISILIA